jgi:plastocyanin
MRVGLLDEESTAPSFKEITMVIWNTMRSALVAAALGAATGVVLAMVVLPVRAQDAAASAVSIDTFTFSPAELTVKVGDTVTWTNRDDIPHGIASGNDAFRRSKALDTDDKFAFTFTAPGSYKYFCYVHPYMTGTIVVQPNGG